jgi:hypothetical protein
VVGSPGAGGWGRWISPVPDEYRLISPVLAGPVSGRWSRRHSPVS